MQRGKVSKFLRKILTVDRVETHTLIKEKETESIQTATLCILLYSDLLPRGINTNSESFKLT
jgi:hypothetical protein